MNSVISKYSKVNTNEENDMIRKMNKGKKIPGIVLSYIITVTNDVLYFL